MSEDNSGKSAEIGNIDHSNINGSNSKRLVQQAFHPGLFTRQRSSSLGSNQSKTQPTSGDQPVDTETETTEPCPPTWQRVPVSRNPKRKKTSNNSSPETVKTSNRFTGLTIDLTNTEAVPKEKRPAKPPPIVLYGVEDVNKLIELLITVVEKDQFSFKIINRNQLRISSLDIETYKQIINMARKNGLIGHTFNRKDQRCFRVVIRNLHPSTPISAIREAIEVTGNIVSGEIINAKFGPDKKSTSTFFVNIAPGPNNKARAQLVHLPYFVVIQTHEPFTDCILNYEYAD
ncbi:unnamed protein product [Arctia plantaginis]|uniref:Uncharacterized protein n=1 Tax=Arctia plantaginis TaxID=874455 RepID=A0A8S1BF04_ARCPL|nr:unnamed protein product [Arctia plantaginis]